MSNSDWFARKMGVPQAQPASIPQTQPQYVAPQPATYVQPTQGQYPPQVQATPPAPTCPSCRSINYGSIEGARARCYDCGYPIVQSASGLGKGIVNPGQASAGPAVPVNQPATGNGFNPGTIIGHI